MFVLKESSFGGCIKIRLQLFNAFWTFTGCRDQADLTVSTMHRTEIHHRSDKPYQSFKGIIRDKNLWKEMLDT